MSLGTIVYLILSLFSIIFGVLYFLHPRNSSIIFLLFGMIAPTSNQFMDFTSFSGVYFYDYFFLSLTIYYIINVAIKKYFLRSNIYNIIFFMSFLLFYLVFAIFSSVPFDKYLLRDLRPFLTLFYGIVCIDLVRKNKVSLSIILNILIVTFVFKLFFFIFLLLGVSFSDIYYQNNAFRYFDASTFVAALFLIVIVFKKKSFISNVSKYKLNIIIVLSIIIVLISNLRIILAALLFVYLVVNHKNLFKKALIVISAIFLFVMYSDLMQAERVINALDFKELLIQFATRFTPAFDKISIMSSYQYLYGLGIGTYFEIPWFEYRGLDSKLNTIDSTYLTFFVKYGLLSIGILFLFFRVLLKNIKDVLLRKSIVVFYLILFVTMSILYQSGAVFQILFLNMLMISINNEDTTHFIPINS
jgi:hypothetical protein